MYSKIIDEYVEKNRDNIAKTLSDLVKLDTTNPGPGEANETKVQDYLEPLLKEIGCETKRVAADPKGERPNLIGKLAGSGGGRDLIIAGHADTVPAGDLDKWDDPPFAGVIRDGCVYGRGATDCRSGLTGAFWAVKTLKECNIPIKGDVYYISSCGEEANEGGTLGLKAALVDEYKDPFCLIAEASNFELHSIGSGLFCFALTVYGKPAHTCRRNQMIYPQIYGVPCGPEVGVDALQKALPYLDYFYRLEKEWAYRFRHEVLGGGGKPRADQCGIGLFTISPTFIEGGMYLCSTMDKVKITFNAWYPEFANRDMLIEEIKAGVAAISATDLWTRENPPLLEIPIEQIWRGFETDASHPAVQALLAAGSEVLGQDVVISGFSAVSDATYAYEKGIKSAIFGTINHNKHGFNEYQSIDDLSKAIKIYARMMSEWCG